MTPLACLGLDVARVLAMLVASREPALSRIGSGAARESALRAEAAAEALTLYRDHGVAAVDILTERMIRPGTSADERRRVRLARLEVERLDRATRSEPWSDAPIAWKPPLFSLARLKGFIGIGHASRGKR